MNAVKTILLVEDDPNDVELMRATLDDLQISGHTRFINNGIEALEFLESCAESRDRDLPAVVVLDNQLPGLTGIELIAKIRENNRLLFLPIVMLTSSMSEEDLQTAYQNGANAYVVKPSDFGAFQEAVREISQFWGQINRPGHLKVS